MEGIFMDDVCCCLSWHFMTSNESWIIGPSSIILCKRRRMLSILSSKFHDILYKLHFIHSFHSNSRHIKVSLHRKRVEYNGKKSPLKGYFNEIVLLLEICYKNHKRCWLQCGTHIEYINKSLLVSFITHKEREERWVLRS